MKYIITEDKLKNFIKRKFNLDLTGKIRMITTQYQVPMEFDIMLSPKSVRYMLNTDGPMYLIQHGYDDYLVQPRTNHKEWRVIDASNGYIDESEFFNKLGVPHIIHTGDLIDAFFVEED
jgi:hypothetical protein